MNIAVLAGGFSKRFGDKLFYMVNGEPMVLRIVNRLRQVSGVDRVYVVTSADRVKQFREIGIEDFIVDHLLIGPLGGVLIALEELGDVFIVAGDMPLVNPVFVEYIIGVYLREKGYYAYIPGWSNGFLEPLHGVYTVDSIEFLKKSLLRREYSLQKTLYSFINRLYIILLDNMPLEYRNSVYNVNTIDDLRMIEHLL